MISPWILIHQILYPATYILIDVTYVRETPKAILIIFDGKKAWLPKAWIIRIKRKKGCRVIASPPKAGEAISVEISEYHWDKKFA